MHILEGNVIFILVVSGGLINRKDIIKARKKIIFNHVIQFTHFSIAFDFIRSLLLSVLTSATDSDGPANVGLIGSIAFIP